MKARPRTLRRLHAIAVACSLLLAGPTAANGMTGGFPGPELANGSRELAQAAGKTLGNDALLAAVKSVAGPDACRRWLWVLANLSSALDVPSLAEDQWRRVALAAVDAGDADLAASAFAGAADATLAIGHYDRASEYAARMRESAPDRSARFFAARADAIDGIVARRRGQLDHAARLQQRAREGFVAAGDLVRAMRAQSDLGTIQRDRGDYAGALESQFEALAVRESIGDHLDILYRNLALLYRDIGDPQTARAYFLKALDAAEKRAVPSAYSTTIGSYSSLLNELGEFADARTAAGKALAIDRALGDLPHQGLEHLEIGRAALGLRDLEGADEHLAAALELGRSLGQREIVARALLHQAEIALQRRDIVRARGLVDEATAGLERSRLKPQLAQAYALREQLASMQGDTATALRYAHRQAALREELLGSTASRRLAALETRAARREADQNLQLLAKDNELQAARIERQELQRRLGLALIGGLGLVLLVLVWRYLAVRVLNRQLSERNREIERQRVALAEAHQRLQAHAAELRKTASTDWLTGLPNRREVLERLDERLRICLRDARPLALMLIDFDNFKQINDLRGHLAGDRALVVGAHAMQSCLGADDIFGRYGGEEFLLVTSDAVPDAVMQLAERIRGETAEQLGAMFPDLRAMATLSIGVAFLDPGRRDMQPEELIEAADTALYQAKQHGRNRVRRAA